MIRGSIRFDGIALGEGTFNFLSPTTQLHAKAAFVSTATGKTHGWTETKAGWSRETLLKLEELRALMERDLASTHLSDAQEPDAADRGLANTTSPAGPAQVGLSEFLQEGDAPQL